MWPKWTESCFLWSHIEDIWLESADELRHVGCDNGNLYHLVRRKTSWSFPHEDDISIVCPITRIS